MLIGSISGGACAQSIQTVVYANNHLTAILQVPEERHGACRRTGSPGSSGGSRAEAKESKAQSPALEGGLLLPSRPIRSKISMSPY